MRFPLTLTTTMVGYLAKKKLSREKRFPLVLMLEPLHACNLTCTGCGRIREYETTIKEKLSVEECLASVDSAAGRRRVVEYLESGPFPHYQAVPGTPGVVVRVDVDGTQTRGRFVGREFQTDPCP